MTFYEKFRQLNIDLSPVGLEPGGVRCFCTPKGAELIGQAGLEGIHYCFIEGFGEMVFAVNPSNLPGQYVYPLAENFFDLLRLLLACGHLDIIEQTYLWDQNTFNDELLENQPESDAEKILDAVSRRLALTPMPEPFQYIKKLQSGFDYSRIQFTEDYSVWVSDAPNWKVFDSSFQTHEGSAGKEIPVRKTFSWGGRRWLIPAVYLCKEGLVIDFCIEAEPEAIRAFLEKWKPGNPDSQPSGEDMLRLELEHPVLMNFRADAVLNGETLRQNQGSGFSWVPTVCLPDGETNPFEAVRVMKHYRLDPFKGWYIDRALLPWADGQIPSFTELQLHLSQSPVSFPGPHFTTPDPGGEGVLFTHPLTGQEHALKVLYSEQAKLNLPDLENDEEWENPNCYTVLIYTLSPDIPSEHFSIQDCSDGDRPKPRTAPSPSGPKSAPSLGLFLNLKPKELSALLSEPGVIPHPAASALHFEPAERIEWRTVFREKTLEDITIEISLNESC